MAWPTTFGTVIGSSIEGSSMLYTATLRYRYQVDGLPFDGDLSRRCLRRRSAERLVKQEPGSPIEVRFNKDRPERSYFAFPLGWGGFIVAGLPVFGLAAFLLFLTYAMMEDRYIEAHDAIPAREWQMLDVPRDFRVQMPGSPSVRPGLMANLQVGGQLPSSSGWIVERNGSYFYVGILQYPPTATVGAEIFGQVLNEIKAENSKRYVYGDEAETSQGKAGREFKFTRPYTILRVFLSGQRLYVIATDWYVNSDERKFLDSFQIQ
jgi:Protein of unknown function (DUF3592)